jgi:hypothetical protein
MSQIILDLLKTTNTKQRQVNHADEYKLKANPNFELIKTSNVTLSNEEEALVLAMIKKCKFHQLIINTNTLLFVNQSYPPAGYGGIYHGLTPFDPRIFHSLFFGCSILKVQQVEDGLEHQWSKAINAVIPDESPSPPSFKTNPDIGVPWYPSLGLGGWISVCSTFDYTTGLIHLYIAVFSGMDKKVHEEWIFYMRHFYNKGFTIGQFHYAMEWFRRYSIENRRRILYIVANHGLPGVRPLSETALDVSSVCDTTSEQTLTMDEVERLRNEDYVVRPEELPSTFRGSGEEGECCTTLNRQPTGLIPDLELTFDDLVPYVHDPTHYLRLSHACQMTGKVVRVEGPAGFIRTFKVKEDFDTRKVLHTFPALGTPKGGREPLKFSSTSLSGEANWSSQYHSCLSDETEGIQPVESLRPIFVRYSDLPLYPKSQI